MLQKGGFYLKLEKHIMATSWGKTWHTLGMTDWLESRSLAGRKLKNPQQTKKLGLFIKYLITLNN